MSDELDHSMGGISEGKHFYQPIGNDPTDERNGWRECTEINCTWHGACIVARREQAAKAHAHDMRWVFEVVFNEGTTKDQVLAFKDRLMEQSKLVGLELHTHGEATIFACTQESLDESNA